VELESGIVYAAGLDANVVIAGLYFKVDGRK
jgi:hypothetical protein